MIHDASAVAVHAHSGWVVTVTVPGPPPAPSDPSGPASDTLHLGADGPVTDSVEVEPHAATKTAALRIQRYLTMGAAELEQALRHPARAWKYQSSRTYASNHCRTSVAKHGRRVMKTIRMLQFMPSSGIALSRCQRNSSPQDAESNLIYRRFHGGLPSFWRVGSDCGVRGRSVRRYCPHTRRR